MAAQHACKVQKVGSRTFKPAQQARLLTWLKLRETNLTAHESYNIWAHCKG